MEQSFKSLIGQSSSVLILLPKNPYFDQVAAGLSLYLSIADTKNVVISCPTSMTVEFNRLIGVDRVTTETGNKNLLIRFSDYKAENIERVKYDVENQEFFLTVIPKAQMEPPKKDQVDVSFTGVSADTIILVGGMRQEHFPELSSKEIVGAKIAHIGTMELKYQGNLEIISFSRPASSVSELSSSFIKELSGKINVDVATNLLMGLYDGSKSFTQNVNENTFKLAADLVSAGARPTAGADTQKSQRQPKRPFPTKPTDFAEVLVKEPKQEPKQKPAEEVKQEEVSPEETPKAWLQTPKIYKGTKVN